jgi:hypothetical protein
MDNVGGPTLAFVLLTDKTIPRGRPTRLLYRSRHENKNHAPGLWLSVLLVGLMGGCSSGAHSIASQPTYLAQAAFVDCRTTMECCIKKHPLTAAESCGATSAEIAEALNGTKVLYEATETATLKGSMCPRVKGRMMTERRGQIGITCASSNTTDAWTSIGQETVMIASGAVRGKGGSGPRRCATSPRPGVVGDRSTHDG